MPALSLYRSSAGSGKTFTLTLEYLALVLQYPSLYRQILAITFTNKATEEMKTRILRELDKLSRGAHSPMAGQLAERTELNDQQVQAQAEKVLGNILHDYSRFSVTTIDTFFQHVIRSFARETGLHPGYNIEMDRDKVLAEITDALMMDVGEDEQLTNWLTRFATEKAEQGKSWHLDRDIQELAKELFTEQFQQHETDLLHAIQQKNALPNFRDRLYKHVRWFEQTMQQYGQQAVAIIEKHGLSVNDFPHKSAGVAGYLHKLAAGDKYDPGKRPRTALEDVSKWTGKNNPREQHILAALEDGLEQQLQEAVQFYDQQFVRYNTGLELLQYLYTFGILGQFTQKLQNYRQENDTMLISDSAQFLSRIIGNNDSSFVYEKIGTNYQHFLVDEFQDTSALQWDNLKPLIHNSLAMGNSNLVVGDVKQSIYRWRGGDMKLLLEHIEQDMEGQQLREIVLNRNWRSKDTIIGFNNTLFGTLPRAASEVYRTQAEGEAIADDDDFDELAQTITRAYDRHEQKPAQPEQQQGGYVEARFIPMDEEEEEEERPYLEVASEQAIAQIEQLQEQGYALKDIAILVRNHKEGREIVHYLMARKAANTDPRYKYDVISAEALTLRYATVVRLLVQALRVINKPEDPIPRAELVHEYSTYCRKQEPGHAPFREAGKAGADLQNGLEELLPTDFTGHLIYLSKLPLYELVEHLTRIFGLDEQSTEFAFLQGFQDVVLEYTLQGKPDIPSFMEWWEESGGDKSIQIAGEQNAIQVMSMHKAKGLQFKVVLVPFCNWELDHKSSLANIICCHLEHSEKQPFPIFPLKYRRSLGQTTFAGDYLVEKMLAFLDNLNLLYVALTRPEEALYIYAPQPDEDKDGNLKIKSVGDLLFRSLDDGGEAERGEFPALPFAGHWSREQGVFKAGELAAKLQEEQEPEEGPAAFQFERYPATNWRGKLSIRQRSKDFFREKETEQASKINYGQLMHQILAEIVHAGDVRQKVQEQAFEGRLAQAEADDITRQLEQLMEQEPIKGWFSEGWQVRNETPILLPDGHTRRPDRVLTTGNKAVIIDFKFVEQEKNEHYDQVREYRQFLEDMGYKEVEGWLLYVGEGLETFEKRKVASTTSSS
jgi:ATP-dependent exoDNAse (exonuclease V) beta subunit